MCLHIYIRITYLSMPDGARISSRMCASNITLIQVQYGQKAHSEMCTIGYVCAQKCNKLQHTVPHPLRPRTSVLQLFWYLYTHAICSHMDSDILLQDGTRHSQLTHVCLRLIVCLWFSVFLWRGKRARSCVFNTE